MVATISDSVPSRTLAGLVAGQAPPAGIPEARWADLIALALDHGLGGMLLWSLRRAGWAQDGDPRWQVLVDAVRRYGRYSLLLERSRRQAAAAFDQGNIPAIWLKGIALARTCYPEPHLRPMYDLDVLVRPGQMAAARQALLGVGFRSAQADFFELGGFTDQARHHEGLVDRTGQVNLELHFRLLAPTMRAPLEDAQMEWFWEQTGELSQAGPSFRVLKPEASLLYLCAHAVLQHEEKALDLLHLLDLHLLVSQGALDWDLVMEQAAALGWTYAVEAALGRLPALYGTRLPEGLLRDLQQQRPAGEPLRVGVGPSGNTRRWVEWRATFRRMTLSQRLRLVWLTLFPPAAFMRRQYHLSPGEPLLPYYLDHFLDGSREAARALWK